MIDYIEKPCCAKPFKQHAATTHCEALRAQGGPQLNGMSVPDPMQTSRTG